jgi:predicted ArsR family transcriptional regulator
MDVRRSGSASGVSRGVVLAFLRSSMEPTTLGAIVSAVGLSAATVRFHLNHLVEAGLITAARGPVIGPGRPKQTYRAMAPEAVDGEAAYRLLAGLLADELARVADPLALVSAGRSWAARVAETAPVVARRRGESAAEYSRRLVVEVFDDGGFAPTVGDSGQVIELHKCPFMGLAAVRPEIVCSVHLGMVQGLLELFDTTAGAGERAEPGWARVRPVLDGSGPCLVILPMQDPRRPG